MKIVVVGGGRVGDALVKYLSQEGHDIVVVDSNQAIIENIGVKYDVNCICGNGAIKEILLAAGANTADIIIAATRQDELNIMCCQIGRLLGAKHSIARVRETRDGVRYRANAQISVRKQGGAFCKRQNRHRRIRR